MTQYITDFEIHSKYARAVSKAMELPFICKWARLKGLDLVTTCDWTHPLWLKEIQEKLEEAPEHPGFFRLRDQYKPEGTQEGFKEPLFFLSTEISSIYIQGGQQRRIHTMIWMPSLSSVERYNKELHRRGTNLANDGRLMTGLSAKQIAQIALETDENCLIIPAHVWTPWYSLYGSRSGFDSLEECFEDLTPHIYAIETGLSSDPAMNWRIKELDRRAIVSFSDAHSGPKMGREATVFEVDEDKLSFDSIRQAVLHETRPDTPTRARIAYTIEFYPEEGKYHYTGHRNCSVKQSATETRTQGGICPVCQRPLTVGVEYRVEKLAGRQVKTKKVVGQNSLVKVVIDQEEHPELAHKPPYVMLIPLQEVLAEALGVGVYTKKVFQEYHRLVKNFGSEFRILLDSPLEEIESFSGPKVAEAIKKVRSQELFIEPGYDGVYGKVRIFSKGEQKKFFRQETLF